MDKKEKFLNLAFGISLIYWGVAGLYSAYESSSIPFLRWFISVLNFSVGALIIFRKPVINKGSLRSIVVSLPSLILGGIIFKFAKPLDSWSISEQLIFVVGGSFSLISFFYLGRSFSIFPDLRDVKSNGTFRLVRHPSYLGEAIMITICLITTDYWQAYIVYVLFIPSLILRIKQEEKLLSTSEVYRTYQLRVKWRLIPYIW